jgi:hypothetical protein
VLFPNSSSSSSIWELVAVPLSVNKERRGMRRESCPVDAAAFDVFAVFRASFPGKKVINSGR